LPTHYGGFTLALMMVSFMLGKFKGFKCISWF